METLISRSLVFKIVTNPKPVIKNVERKGAGESSQKVSLRIDKRDIRTERALEGAVFQLSCDGKAIVDVITDADGKAQYIYERLLKTKTYTVSKKNMCQTGMIWIKRRNQRRQKMAIIRIKVWQKRQQKRDK